MYTLDQQLKDIDRALKEIKTCKKLNHTLYLCNISQSISTDFYGLIVRAFKRLIKISPKAYSTTISDPSTFRVGYKGSSPSLWYGTDYDSRKQFLQDLKEHIIKNG